MMKLHPEAHLRMKMASVQMHLIGLPSKYPACPQLILEDLKWAPNACLSIK